MNAQQEFSKLYRYISESINASLEDISELNITNKEGREQLEKITQTLKQIQSEFNEELEFLENNAEWEKFTMAFFGETNAGKSTIIESLRILFDESSRKKFLEENKNNIEELSQKLKSQAQQAEAALNEAYKQHAERVASLRKECGELKKIISAESEEKIRIVREESSLRVKWKIAIGCLSGFLAGAAVTLFLL